MDQNASYQKLLCSVLKKKDNSPNSESKKKKVEFNMVVSDSPSPVVFEGFDNDQSTSPEIDNSPPSDDIEDVIDPFGSVEYSTGTDPSKLPVVVDCDAGLSSLSDDVVGNSDCVYNCKRCRRMLFSSTQITQHRNARGRSSSICTSTVYIPYFRVSHYQRTDVGSVDPLRLRLSTVRGQCEEDFPNIAMAAQSECASDTNAHVVCAGCDTRFGQYCEHDTKCMCGALAVGPLIRLGIAKVDCSRAGDADLCPMELARRAAAEMAALRMEDEEAVVLRGDTPKKSKKKPGRQKREGEGNFTMFRNKSFKGKGAAAAATSETSPPSTEKKKKKKRGGRARRGSTGGSSEEEGL